MSETATKLDGQCLCGAITFTVKTATRHVGVCHCSMCRTWSGGVVFAIEDATDLQVSGEENLGVYKSSDWGERCFCKVCGTNLFWRSESFGHTAVMAGALTDHSGLTFTSEIYIDSKPDFYDFANDTKKMTEQEFTAQFVQSDSNET